MSLRLGLIPAWAGKTMAGSFVVGAAGAHPRVGGENGPGIPSISRPPGSSPRGRGKREEPRGYYGDVGLIPAWAGKTLSDLRFYRADRSDLGNP